MEDGESVSYLVSDKTEGRGQAREEARRCPLAAPCMGQAGSKSARIPPHSSEPKARASGLMAPPAGLTQSATLLDREPQATVFNLSSPKLEFLHWV